MPWYNGDFPPSYKNQPVPLREKAVAIANALLGEGMEEGIAIATGLKRARQFFDEHDNESLDVDEVNKTEGGRTFKETTDPSKLSDL